MAAFGLPVRLRGLFLGTLVFLGSAGSGLGQFLEPISTSPFTTLPSVRFGETDLAVEKFMVPLPEAREEPEREASLAEKEASVFPIRASFDNGVSFSALDDEFELRLHILQQTDFKLFLPTYQEPARSGVYVPRFRIYFEGHITKSFEYELSLQRSVEGNFDVLDANINFRPNDAFQIKVGRFLVPYSYDWYDHLEQFFITPERSLFPLNFGLSREAGVMVWGKPFEERIQYAVGGFSGQLAGLAETNTTRDAVGYLNARPFLTQDAWPALRFLNIGGSLGLGQQAHPETPLPLRTSIQSSENDEAAEAASTVFLEFADDVVAFGGGRFTGALHLAWYVGRWSLEAEWQTGRFPYQRPGLAAPVKVPVQGYHVALGSFVTGEQVEGRGLVIPLRPFSPADGVYGPGAIEMFGRFSRLDVGQEIFDNGLADPALWSRQANMTDIGFNWHPNRYIRFTFDWQRTWFGSPVALNEEQGRSGSSVDLFWIRGQVWF